MYDNPNPIYRVSVTINPKDNNNSKLWNSNCLIILGLKLF